MLQVQKKIRGTRGFRHRNKYQQGKNMQCDFWKRQLVAKSIPNNPTWRTWPPFRRRPISPKFPIIVFCLSGPPQQEVASLSHFDTSSYSGGPHLLI